MNDKDRNLKPYIVEVEKKLSQTIVVYAEDNYEAEEIADALCYSGKLNFSDSDIEELKTEAFEYKNSENDPLDHYKQFFPEQIITLCCGKVKFWEKRSDAIKEFYEKSVCNFDSENRIKYASVLCKLNRGLNYCTDSIE